MAAMYDEQNARRLLADPVAFHNEATTAAMLPLLIALDAERARAAELQQRLDAQPYESESELVRLLAAREAEVREAREALEVLARLGNGDRLGNSEGNMIAQRALSRAPGGNEALRTLLRDALRRAHNAGWVHHQVGEAGRNVIGNDGWEDNDAIERSLLGPTGDGARKGAEG